MSKSKLRQEYEDRMGVVEDYLQLFNAKGKVVYYENSRGFWAKYKYNDEGQEVYFENSDGWHYSNRPKRPKLWTDENGVQYKLTEVRK